MLRSRIKLGVLVGGLAVSALASLPASAQNPTTDLPATNVPPPDVRARQWAATARYVYADDPALASLRPQLLQTIDSSSVRGFGRGLEKAVLLEKQAAPRQGHTLKLLELFKTLSTPTEPAEALAASITDKLLANKPERQQQPGFARLRTTLLALARPTAPVAARPVASPDTAAAASLSAAPAAAPLPVSNATITPTSSTPMISWVALALSIISLLVSIFRSGSSRGRHRHSHSSSTPSLTSLTEDMRTEIHTMVQREVGKRLGNRPAPDAPAKPAAPTAPPKSVPAEAAAPKPAPAPTPVAAPPPPAASPAPAEPVASAEPDDFFDQNFPTENEPVAAPPVAPATRTLYANQQPIDGTFKREMLAEAPASYTIFELTMGAGAPDQAQFVVTSNAAGHAGYIGSHQNILGGACEYPFPKGSVSRIITDTPGQAQRTASGDWQITRKAQVHFE